jgi:hypothetical protein
LRVTLTAVVAGLGIALGLTYVYEAAARPSRSDKRAATRVISVNERDFRITAPRHIAAGTVELTVHNHGPDTHELIIVRTDASRLPLRSDGLTVNEELLQRRTALSLDGAPAGTTRHIRVHLAPGTYTLFCNMAGHYLGGMHTTLVVH